MKQVLKHGTSNDLRARVELKPMNFHFLIIQSINNSVLGTLVLLSTYAL